MGVKIPENFYDESIPKYLRKNRNFKILISSSKSACLVEQVTKISFSLRIHEPNENSVEKSNKVLWPNILNHLKWSTPFAKHFDMDKLFKILWRGRKQGRCGRTSLSLAWEIAHIYLVFAHAREISKVCSYRSPWQKL